MKRVLFILVAGLMTITGCYKEKPIHAPLLPNKYDVSDNPSDSIQHFKHMFYKKYKTYFLTNPTISDYRFNFKDKNNIDIIPLKQNPRIVQKGIDLFNECFANKYSEDFKNANLPYSIIIADSISLLSYVEKKVELYGFASTNFLAMSCKGAKTLTDELKSKITGEVNAAYWVDYLGSVKNVFNIPESFYAVTTEEEYKKIWEENPAGINFYQYGFVSYDELTSIYDKEEDSWWVEPPKKERDSLLWIRFIFSTKKDVLKGILQANPKMQAKYDILKDAFKKAGYDITTL